MAVQVAPASGPRNPWRTDAWRKDVALILLLFALVAALRGAVIARTVVPARDTIGYIRYALDFERLAGDGRHNLWQAWQEVLCKHHQHPAYSLSVLAISWPIRAWYGGTDAEAMQLSAQLASTLAALLLILPMYFIGKALSDRRIAFWGTLLFHVLPLSAHLLSDGLSEGLFLLLSMSALLFAVQGMRLGSPVRFGLCGLFCGLSYLTRPEAVLVLIAVGLVLAAAQTRAAWRRPWQRFALAQACLLVPAVAVSALYWTATHKFTNKPSIDQIIDGYQVQRDSLRDERSAPEGDAPEGDAPPGDAPESHALQARGLPAGGMRPRPLLASLWAAAIKRGGSITD